ncbi:MAG: aminoacyl-tRNA hydrolase [Ruminococcaceae bacterium]|nr:aminoacyl-tRNA hydrolase [Oscillospiraceae bacterium]
MNVFSAFKKSSIDFAVVGLGNPGAKYDKTRHNVGFNAMDYIANKYSAQLKKLKFSALTEKCTVNGKSVLLIKPQTYMNNSGEAVGAAARFYKLSPSQIIVVCDDISLPCGTLRLRMKGSAGGHNGLKSINSHLGSEEYPRIKIGVGEKPSPDYDLADWVLGVPSDSDVKLIESRNPDILKTIELLVEGKTDAAMNECNRSVK